MIKVKYGQIYNSQDAFNKLLKEPMPFKSMINIKKLIEKISKELQLIETERITLIKKYGEEKEDGNTEVKQENMEVFVKELNELMDVEVEFAEVEKINPDDLNYIKITLADLYKLEPFILN